MQSIVVRLLPILFIVGTSTGSFCGVNSKFSDAIDVLPILHSGAIIENVDVSRSSNSECPVDLCYGTEGILFNPSYQSRLFVVCLNSHKFCGYCPMGMAFNQTSMICIPSKNNPADWALPDCQLSSCSLCRLTPFDNRTFQYCSDTLNFCGACPKSMMFDAERLTCVSHTIPQLTPEIVNLKNDPVKELLHQVDHPAIVLTVSPNIHLSDVFNGSYCPIDLCKSFHAILLLPDVPRLFVVCASNRRFCGLCPDGTKVKADQNSFRCVNSTVEANVTSESCVIENCDEQQSTIVDNSRFRVCSSNISFCAFCPQVNTRFDPTLLNCSVLFPEIEVECKPSNEVQIMSDPLNKCSPLAYVCLPESRLAHLIRCPDPRTRHNEAYLTCDMPEDVPECGGILHPLGKETANNTGWEVISDLFATLGRGGAVGNCIANCMRSYTPKTVCVRVCT